MICLEAVLFASTYPGAKILVICCEQHQEGGVNEEINTGLQRLYRERKDHKQMKEKKKKIIIAAFVVITVVTAGAITVYACYHRWNDATCAKPKTCTISGESRGRIKDE